MDAQQAPIDPSLHRGNVLVGAGINLYVASSDDALLATCREVLRELEPAKEVSERDGAQRQANICLWDFEPGGQNVRFPKPGLGQTIFYVVRAAHLDLLREAYPEAEGNILLKPVTRVVLRAFLGSARLPREPRPSASSMDAGPQRTHQDEMLQHLLHANLRLQEYDQQRTNFIARALHDFRAPLTALSGFCGLLAGGELGPLSGVQHEVLSRMQRSTGRLAHMATTMFELSAGPHVGRTPDLREGDILEAILQSTHEIALLAGEKHIEVRTDHLEPPPAELHFERSQIEQVLVNLLDNACKFAPKFGWIEVRSYPYFWERRHLGGKIPLGTQERRLKHSSTPNAYRVDILDNGPGVSPDLLEHIFEEYTSYSGSQDRSGGGLGLAICRLIISRHQGHVWAEASAEGSLFSFVLPLRSRSSGDGASESEA